MRVVLRPGRTGTRERTAAKAGQSHVGQERPTWLWLRSEEMCRCIERCRDTYRLPPDRSSGLLDLYSRSLRFRGCDDLRLQVRGHLVVVRVLHVVRAAAAG